MTAHLPRAPRKIAVFHAKALGDFIVTLPALTAIKETYPSAELVLLAKPWVKAFLAARPSVIDRVISVPALTVMNAPANSAEIELFCAAMRTEKFDIILHMQGDGKIVNPFINKLGAGLTAGMRGQAAEAIDRFIPYVHYQNEVLRNLEIAALIGASTTKLEPHIEVTDADEQEASSVREIIKGRPYVIIHAGADDTRRLWPVRKFACVADDLIQRGYEVVLTGTPKEAETVADLMRTMNNTAIPCISLALGGLAALLQQGALVISNDTGPLHLARAVGTRTVGILWAPNVLNWGPLSRDRHRLAISWQLECPACGIKPVSPWPFQPVTARCEHWYSFVEPIPVEEVLGLALELLPSASA
jgi:ADP-heptose:LPS heptosyltransferase